MTIEIVAIPGLIFLATTIVARLIELQNDVLYGPYIAGRKHSFVRFRYYAAEMLESLDLRQGFGRAALKVGTIGLFSRRSFARAKP
jgi:hypothetical protein